MSTIESASFLFKGSLWPECVQAWTMKLSGAAVVAAPLAAALIETIASSTSVRELV